MKTKVKLFEFETNQMRTVDAALKSAESEVNRFTATHKAIDVHMSMTTDKHGEIVVVFCIVYEE